MQHTFREQVIAFAGMWQAAALVQQVARRGSIDPDEFETCIRSLFVTDPRTVEEVYGNDLKKLQHGLTVILDQFGEAQQQRDMELTKYVIAMLHLERKLARNSDMLYRIGKGVNVAQAQAEHFSATHENVISNLADLYSDTISTLQPRIMVAGEQGHLAHPGNAAKVRALLLAGIRSAVLWHQCGGSRLRLLFQRKALVQEAKALLSDF